MGHAPSHLDSHQHVHLREPVRTILIEMARAPWNSAPTIARREVSYRGSFYGQTAEGTPLPDVISVDGLIRILETLPAGCTELACHPADGVRPRTPCIVSERLEELKVLCDARVRAAITAMGIELCSFTSLPNGHAQPST